MDAEFKSLTYLAQKHVRRKDYDCLFPGCNKRAILSHGIPRSSIIEALADNRHVYTRRPSIGLSPPLKPSDLVEVVEIGVNQAGTYKGFCPAHDQMLFRPAETTKAQKRRAMFISLHLRAMCLEYARERETGELLRKSSELVGSPDARAYLRECSQQFELHSSRFRDVYVNSAFNLIGGSNIDSIEYWCVPFSRNLGVSCCGCFSANEPSFDSYISYNLISYADISILVLTVFKVVEHYLDLLLAPYQFPKYADQLVNDIAFFHCEEPLMSPAFWRALSEGEKIKVRSCLRYPPYRSETKSPIVIRLSPSDYVKEITPEVLNRLALH